LFETALKNITDEEFDSFYPMKMRKLSATHWTPVAVARKAAEFLVKGVDTKVLDIGSGAGKFCVLAANFTSAQITGVERRENLVLLSRKLAMRQEVKNVNFVHADIKDIDFKAYDSFYFFNAFEENINLTDKLDSSDSIDSEQYRHYCQLLHDRFDEARIGTRVVTYCGEGKEIPDSFTLVRQTNKGKLLFWEKRG
jgi:SAM-dependent methyltransferase